MSLSRILLPEIEHELKLTRTLLERLPIERADFKPHPKSMAAGELATHLSNLGFWGVMTLTETELDVAPGGKALRMEPFATLEEILAHFDKHAGAFKEALAAASDEQLMTPWTLKNNGQAVFTLPRVGVLRSFVISHMIHHRGQFTVYLRMLDVALPPIYGPTADTGK